MEIDYDRGRKKQTLPPRRGQVKARIFGGIAGTISKVVGSLYTTHGAPGAVTSSDSESTPTSGQTADKR